VTIRYWQKARKAGLPVGDDFGEFYKRRRMDGPAAPPQGGRHFCPPDPARRQTAVTWPTRPRFIAYMRATCARYMELKPLLRLIERIEGIEVPNAYAFGRTLSAK
jgi:aminoglycoside/choline kinase family phosphotransferase